MRLAALLLLLAMSPAAAQPVLWAWERSEALDAIPPTWRVAAVVGVIQLRGDAIIARGRRFPLRLAEGAAPPIGVVHIEIDPSTKLLWNDRLRAQVVEAALAYARGYQTVQIDMEVRRSQRPALLDVLRAVRAGLPEGARLSMTALAAWCDTEHWLADAPVDEVVPMLFRLGRNGARLRAKLEAGGDFAEPRCRTALGISLDAPIAIPPGRTVYVFNPHPWDSAALADLAAKDLR